MKKEKEKRMARKNCKTTTYSLDWETIIGLESRLLRDFRATHNPEKARALLMVSIGARLGLRVIDNLSLRWMDLLDLAAGQQFVRCEKKTGKERLLVMSTKLREVIDTIVAVLKPEPNHLIFSSQKGKGVKHMTVQTFNRLLKEIMNSYKVKYVGNCSSHLLRKSWICAAIKNGVASGDGLALVKVSKLINHSSVSVTLRYTNFETSTALSLYELE